MPNPDTMADRLEPIRLTEYVATALDTFAERPFCSVDAVVLAETAALHLEGLLPGIGSGTGEPGPFGLSGEPTLRDLLRSELFGAMFQGFPPERTWGFLSALAGSPRFRDLRVRWPEGRLDEGRGEQFAALTVSCEGHFDYVAFRGTDGSVAGWRENFMMAYRWPVPSQADAVRYLETVGAKTKGPLYVGGHSKGGNLAVYAAVQAQPAVRERIVHVYDFDGPGFRDEAFSAQQYAQVADRVEKYVPEESMVGLVMENATDLHVVQSDGHGLEQHSTFRWHIDPNTHELVAAEKLADAADRWRRTLAEWMRSYSDQGLEEAVDALFAAVEASEGGAGEVFEDGVQGIMGLMGSARSMDEGQRKVLAAAISSFRGQAVRTARDDLVGSVSQRYRGAVDRVSSVAGGVWELATGTEEEKARLREGHDARMRERDEGKPEGRG